LPPSLIERLAEHRLLAGVPHAELEWLAAHGTLHVFEAGAIVSSVSKPLESLWIILNGHVAIRVDRGSGPRTVMEWRSGDVSGLLPYSRMRTPPGNSMAVERTEALEVRGDTFPELIRECYCFTAACVHAMLDRARVFTTTDLQDEKMQSLGRLAAGLAHELNNPASAVARSAAALRACLNEADVAARALGAAGVDDAHLAPIDRLCSSAAASDNATRPLTSLEQADRESAVADWLGAHGIDEGAASSLARLPDPIAGLERVAASVDRTTLAVAVRYIAAEAETCRLTQEIERAASRISDLIAAVRRFTYLDQAAALKPVDISTGLRDTLTMLNAKAKAKSVAMSLEIEPDLPTIPGVGGELNQVWMNLVDNAIDAVGKDGHVTVSAAHDADSVMVRVVDDGPGIPEAIRARIFDPFFTTKQPGEGTGLGLDIVRRLVSRNKGEVDVASAPGRTEFRVTLARR